VLPHLCARGAGQIMNVSSMLGRIPFPSLRSAYSAAKAALGSLTTNLRVDLRAKHPGVAVTMVYPGVVATDFGLNARHGGPDNRALPFAQPVDEVAAIMADAIERPRAEVYTRPMFREQVAEIESRPPFAPTAMKLV
jgi:short-subunit dehydrogenase